MRQPYSGWAVELSHCGSRKTTKGTALPPKEMSYWGKGRWVKNENCKFSSQNLRIANSQERSLYETCREKVARRGASVRTAVRAPRLTTFFARLARDGTNKG